MSLKSYKVWAMILMGVALGFMHADQALAATKTVCAAGCDYTNLHDLSLSGTLSPGDTINVEATYSTAGEVFDVGFTTPNLTLDCRNSGAIIGGSNPLLPVKLYVDDGNIVRNCTFSNLMILGALKSGVRITNNTFNGFSYIELSGDRPQVNNNLHLDRVYYHDLNDGEVANNVMDTEAPIDQSVVITNVHGMNITNNSITNTTVSSSVDAIDMIMINGGSTDVVVDSNSLETPDLDFINYANMINIQDSGVQILGNRILFGSPTPGGSYNNGIMISAAAGEVHVVTDHNTLKVRPSCLRCDGITYADWTVNKIYATSTFNLITVTEPSDIVSGSGFSSFDQGPDSNVSWSSDYNAAIGFPGAGDSLMTYGPHSYLKPMPYFKTDDADPNNDWELKPFGFYLDVEGTNDIGAATGTRLTHFHIDQHGTVDYVNVHATDTKPIADNLRTGDTVTFAPGAYSPLYITGSPLLTGNLTITGSGATTVFQATSTGSAVLLTDISSSTLSDFQAKDSATAQNIYYTMTRAQLSHGGTTYDQGALVGAPNATIIVTGTPAGGTCPTVRVDSDDDIIPTSIGTNGQNWNMALIIYAGARLTIYGSANFIPDAAAVMGCAAPGLITVDKFVSDIFTSSGIILTFNQATATAAGITVKPGDIDPPAITRHVTYLENAGLALVDSNANDISGMTSADNGFGLILKGTSSNNVVSNSTLSGNTVGDLFHESSGHNRLDDVTFDRASTLFQGTGYLDVRYSFRALLRNTIGNAVPYAPVNFISANAAFSAISTTGGLGYTPYLSPTLAYRLTSADISEKAGGYNPYSAKVLNLAGYNNLDQAFDLIAPFQTVNLTVARRSSPSSDGSGWGDLPTAHESYQTYQSDGQGGGSYIVQTGSSSGNPAYPALAKLADDGNPATQEDSAVYYLGTDARRHAFPNEKVYFSWYRDYSRVKIVAPTYLSSFPLGANVTYRPGQRLVKFISQPQVYAVGDRSSLLPVPDEETAARFWGIRWNKKVDDISDAFFGDYAISRQSYDGSAGQISDTTDISADLGLPTDNGSTIFNNGNSADKTWPFRHFANDWSFKTDLGTMSRDVVSVRALQEVLAYMGPDIYPEGSNTGNFGVLTEQAVKNYQQSVGLDATGFVGPATRAKLNAYLDGLR